MKKVISLKEIMVILISVVLVAMSANVLATDSLFLDSNNSVTTITGNEYSGAQTVPEDTNTTGNNTANNVTNNILNNVTKNNTTNNSVKKYNANNTTDLPQTGIEDYNIGILLIICVASAIFAYKKVSDYKNI